MNTDYDKRDDSPDEKLDSKESSRIRDKNVIKNEKYAYPKLLIRKLKRFASNYYMTSLQKKIWLSLLMIIALTVAFISIFSYGYNLGKEDTLLDQKNNSTNPFRNINSPISTLSGNLRSISDSEIVIQSIKGEEVNVKINSETKVYLSGKQLSLSELKNGQRVTVIISSFNDNEQIATRINIRK